MREIAEWSRDRFGTRAALRYRDLLKQALRDIAADPESPGSRIRPELAPDVRTYHLLFSRDRVKGAVGSVKTSRHLVVYRRRGESAIEVIRVLHDARDLARHLPSS
jgi:toxin ParE1/3/4